MMSPTELDEFYVELGNRIRGARLLHQIGQEELASQLELSRASLVNIEKGRQRPMIHTLVSIAKLLNVPLHNLVPNSSPVRQDSSKRVPYSYDDILNSISDEVVWDEKTQKSVLTFLQNLKNTK